MADTQSRGEQAADKAEAKAVVSVRLSTEQVAHLEWLAKAEGIAVSDLIRRAVDNMPWLTMRAVEASN
jgi:hypothetical protein